MAKDLNKVQLTGHLGADPEMRYITNQNGRPLGRDEKPPAVTTFRVASNRTWNDREGGRQEETEWFNIVAWGRLAEVCAQYLGKGTRVYIEGRLQTSSWQDQQSGQTRYKTEVIAQDMIIISNGRGHGGEEDYDPASESDAPPPATRRAPATSANNRGPGRGPGRAPAPAQAAVGTEDQGY